MTTLPVSPGGMTIFCDDVRTEDNGKQFYIGVYQGQMLISPSFPAVLPTFAMVMRYQERAAETRVPLTFLIRAPGHSEPIFKAPVSIEQIEAFPTVVEGGNDDDGEELLAVITIVANFKNLVIEQAGRIRVTVLRGDDEIRLGGLVVSLHPQAKEAAN